MFANLLIRSSCRALASNARLTTMSSFRNYTNSTNPPSRSWPEGFTFWPDYFRVEEQKTLLEASLHKLDNTESLKNRRRRRNYQKSLPTANNVQSIFLPDEYYEFQEGHYDGVIHDYREMHLAAWPDSEFEGLSAVLQRLYDLCPSQNVQTHLLHLATTGYILPHIDNVDASGTWILGVSLGAERLLHLEAEDGSSFQLPLPSGSVYLQSGDIRYKYQHSITHKLGKETGQRLSVMIRDVPMVTKRQ